MKKLMNKSVIRTALFNVFIVIVVIILVSACGGGKKSFLPNISGQSTVSSANDEGVSLSGDVEKSRLLNLSLREDERANRLRQKELKGKPLGSGRIDPRRLKELKGPPLGSKRISPLELKELKGPPPSKKPLAQRE